LPNLPSCLRIYKIIKSVYIQTSVSEYGVERFNIEVVCGFASNAAKQTLMPLDFHRIYLRIVEPIDGTDCAKLGLMDFHVRDGLTTDGG